MSKPTLKLIRDPEALKLAISILVTSEFAKLYSPKNSKDSTIPLSPSIAGWKGFWRITNEYC